MIVPPPRQQLANCMWLPRIIAKARLLREGRLPPEYLARFGAPNGVDETFLHYFAITKDEITEAAKGTDGEIAQWFSNLPQANPTRVREWNHIAENLGRPGFPLEARLPVGLSTTYAHLAHRKPDNIFLMLEMDEGLA